MTRLTRAVSRETTGRIFERSVYRQIIVTLEPPCKITLRLKGTRRRFALDAETVYQLAVKAAMREAEQEKARKSKDRRGRR